MNSQNLKIFIVNAFTNGSFSGNPAAYIPLHEWLPDATLQALAEQNNLSETVFTVPEKKSGDYQIRWFTPAIEVRLCGHATLACAHILFELLNHDGNMIKFSSKSGPISVAQSGSMLTLDFPSDKIEPLRTDLDFEAMLGTNPVEAYRGNDDLLLIYDRSEDVLNMHPDFEKLAQIDSRGVIVSARAQEQYDFISRAFYPAAGINEDPATGSAHTTLVPYWAQRMDKNSLISKQCSNRGGYFNCTYLGERTQISGKCETYLTGEITI